MKGESLRCGEHSLTALKPYKTTARMITEYGKIKL